MKPKDNGSCLPSKKKLFLRAMTDPNLTWFEKSLLWVIDFIIETDKDKKGLIAMTFESLLLVINYKGQHISENKIIKALGVLKKYNYVTYLPSFDLRGYKEIIIMLTDE